MLPLCDSFSGPNNAVRSENTHLFNNTLKKICHRKTKRLTKKLQR